MEVRIIGCMDNTMDNTFESANRVYDKEGLCPTIPTGAGGGHTPKVIDFAKTTRGSDVVSTIRASYYKNGERNIMENVMTGKGCEGVIERVPVRMVGRNPDNPTSRKAGLPTQQMIEPVESGLCGNLTTVQKDNLVLEKKPELQYRIRKLTPRECYRLMDFPDSDFDKAAEVITNTRLYKTAGNAIVRAVLMALFLQMNIQGIKNWNDRTDSEKRTLLEETRCARF